MYILHLSDLHFGTQQDANRWYGQLTDDLRGLLSQLESNQSPHLDALIISGDIANKSLPEEYKAAERFINRLLPEFGLQRHQIVIVPGNHDLNWDSSKKAYEIIQRESYEGSLDDEDILNKDIIVDGNFVLVPKQEEYEERFKHFSNFYENVIAKPYPRQYRQQYELRHFPDQNLLILGLNSAWKLNHHENYRSRASINPDVVENALDKINHTPTYRDSKLKIAVWHHPLYSPHEDRIKDHGFMQRLATNNFRLAFHGHIHRANAEDYKYNLAQQIDIIAAGTFGAPVKQWVPGYPLQYNLLKWQDNILTVYTRKRIELNGAFQPDAMWFQDGLTARSYYQLKLWGSEGSEKIANEAQHEADKRIEKSKPEKQIVKSQATVRINMTNTSFDVFLSHNSNDKENVRQIGAELKKRGLKVWLDEWELTPGRPWQEEIEKIISTTKSAIVIVGKDGLGPWEQPEMQACLNEFVNRKLPVIPVLLPGAAKIPDLPLFLQAFTWVDLRNGLKNDGLDRLEWGITGKKPGKGEQLQIEQEKEAVDLTDVPSHGGRLLEPSHFKSVLQAITRGKLVPFLGSGINLCDRVNNQNNHDLSLWQVRDYPPTRSELAIFLEKKLFGHDRYFTGAQCPLCESEEENLPEGCPIKNQTLLTRLLFQHVSQFGEINEQQRDVIENALNTISTNRYIFNRLHNFFAQLPEKLTTKGYPTPKLIVTANFDSTLEYAFTTQKQKFDLVYYVDREKIFFHQEWGKNKPYEISEPNTYHRLELDKRPVILKLYGPMFGINNPKNDFVITEDHFIDYLAQSNISQLLPQDLLALLHNSKILFLGYGLSHWDERVVLHRIWPKDKYPIKQQGCWAIQAERKALDKQLWKQAEVESIWTSLEYYITELDKRVEQLEAKKVSYERSIY